MGSEEGKNLAHKASTMPAGAFWWVYSLGPEQNRGSPQHSTGLLVDTRFAVTEQQPKRQERG